jgi:glycosyltransferase involved in cell wall biosynthesis
MNKMKYVIFGDASYPHVYKWYLALSEHYDVHVISFASGDNIKFSYRNLHTIDVATNQNGGNFRLLAYTPKIGKILRSINPDIVNAHYLTSYGFITALLKPFIPNTKIVMSAWGSDILVTPQRNVVYKYITKFTLKCADLITSDCHYMSDVINQLVKKGNVSTFPMGIDESQVLMNTEKQSIFTFLSLRTLVKNSNVDLIIDAFNKVHLLHPNTQLLIAHKGNEEEYLKSKVRSLGITDAVKFLGFLTAEELENVMSNSHVYLSMLTSDAVSVSLLETMASEMIVIASDLPANKEFITDQGNGFITSISSEHINSAMLQCLAMSDAERELIYSKCRDIILEKAIWKNNYSYYLSCLEKL